MPKPLATGTGVIVPSPKIWPPVRTLIGLQPKPPRGHSYITAYGRVGYRLSDHVTDYLGVDWIRSSYSKRQPFNCDNTLAFLDSSDGYWHIYDVPNKRYVKRLQGPAGDNAEMQWDKNNRNIAYYGELNGGLKISAIDVSQGTHGTSTLQYDFGPEILAIFPTAVHCWSGAEGSPSIHGNLWGYKAEDANFNCLGLFVMDIFTRQIIWHLIGAPHGRPDNTSVTPSGKYMIVSDDSGMYAITIATGQVRYFHHKTEHMDTFLLANGHDGIVSMDYESTDNRGDIFWIDLEDPTLTRHVFDYIYANNLYGTNYEWHVSGRALNKPGFLVMCNEGNPPANMYIYDTTTGKKYPFAGNYTLRASYFDEPHAAPSSDLSIIMHDDNYGIVNNEDGYMTYIPRIG